MLVFRSEIYEVYYNVDKDKYEVYSTKHRDLVDAPIYAARSYELVKQVILEVSNAPYEEFAHLTPYVDGKWKSIK